jgi:hypothetical protein
MNLNEILFLDVKNSCMKKTTKNPKAKNAPTRRLQPSVTQHGAKNRHKIVSRNKYEDELSGNLKGTEVGPGGKQIQIEDPDGTPR